MVLDLVFWYFMRSYTPLFLRNLERCQIIQFVLFWRLLQFRKLLKDFMQLKIRDRLKTDHNDKRNKYFFEVYSFEGHQKDSFESYPNLVFYGKNGQV